MFRVDRTDVTLTPAALTRAVVCGHNTQHRGRASPAAAHPHMQGNTMQGTLFKYGRGAAHLAFKTPAATPHAARQAGGANSSGSGSSSERHLVLLGGLTDGGRALGLRNAAPVPQACAALCCMGCRRHTTLCAPRRPAVRTLCRPAGTGCWRAGVVPSAGAAVLILRGVCLACVAPGAVFQLHLHDTRSTTDTHTQSPRCRRAGASRAWTRTQLS
jgi:hypothetical protein